jgi:uncharacterized protein (TIGR02246 family)
MREEAMKWLRKMLPITLIAFVLPVSAQSVDPSIRQASERITAVYTEAFNKQDAAGVAGTFTNDGLLISQAPTGAAHSGTQALVQRYEALFKLGANHIDITTSQVAQLAPDVIIAWGEYRITGQGQSGPIKVDGDWSATDVRDGGVWKIRVLNAVPKPPPPATK